MSNEVKLKFKSEYDGKGADKAKASVKGVARETKKATATMSAFGSIAGMTTGPVGKLAMAVRGLSAAFMANPLIAAVALLSAIGAGLKYLYDRAEKAKQALAEMREKALAKLIKDMDDLRLDNLNKQLARATAEAQKAEKAFLSMAAAKAKLTQGEVNIQQAKSGLGIAQIEQEKQAAMMAEPSESKRAVIGAEFDTKIAQAAAKMEIDAAKAELAAAEQQVNTAGDLMAERARVEARSQEALKTAQSEFDKTVGNDESRIKTFEGKLNEARSVSEDATASYIDAENAYRASQQELLVKRLALEKKNVATQTKTTAVNNREKEIKDEYNSLLEKQNRALEMRQKVEDAIKRQTDKQLAIQTRISNLMQAGQAKAAARDAAVAQGAAGFNANLQAKREARMQQQKDDAREERAVMALKSRRSITEGQRQRIENWDRFQALRNQGAAGGKEFDQAKNLQDQLKAVQENLAELKKLNKNIEDAITVP